MPPGLPDQWFISAERNGAGAAAIVNQPAPATRSLTYVVTHIRASLTVFAPLGAPYGPIVSISDTGFVAYESALVVAGNAGDFAEIDADFALVISMGGSVSATFSAGGMAGLIQDIALTGYIV